MIREIACDIKNQVLSSGYVSTHFEYCELIREGNITYPAQYVGGGNYTSVLNQDVNGNSYLRKNGNVSFSNVSGSAAIKTQSCGGVAFVKMNYPLRLVMTVPRTKLNDDAFSDDLLCQEMIALLQADATLQLDGVRSLEYLVTEFDIDALSIWSKEVIGKEHQMNFKFSYVAINFNAIIEVNTDCLTRLCNGY